MSYIKIFLFGLMLCALVMAGCSSNTSSSSGFGSGSGFSINLTATQTILPQGGSTTLFAIVKDAQGNPVNDSSAGVTFTNSLGGGIATQPTSISGGVSTATYTAPGASSSSSGTTTGTTGVDQVTASYRGAFAFVSIFVFKP